MNSGNGFQYWTACLAIVSLLGAAAFALLSIWVDSPEAVFLAKLALSAFIVFLFCTLLNKTVKDFHHSDQN